jgi:hypothetical protein
VFHGDIHFTRAVEQIRGQDRLSAEMWASYITGDIQYADVQAHHHDLLHPANAIVVGRELNKALDNLAV